MRYISECKKSFHHWNFGNKETHLSFKKYGNLKHRSMACNFLLFFISDVNHNSLKKDFKI